MDGNNSLLSESTKRNSRINWCNEMALIIISLAKIFILTHKKLKREQNQSHLIIILLCLQKKSNK